MNYNELPECIITDEVSVMEVMRKASQVLDKHNIGEQAKELCYRVTMCEDKYIAREIISEYVNIVDESTEVELWI